MPRPDLCRVFRFGVFEADVHAGELRKNGAKVPLQEQPFQVLAALLQRPGELVWREDLRQEVWPQDTYVEFDHALNTAVKKIRIALGDCANSPEYVETIPKRGYRFLVPVEVVDDPELSKRAEWNAAAKYRADRWFPRTWVPVALFVLVMLSAALALRWSAGLRNPGVKRMVLAVLPFQDSSDGSGHASLCDGLTQELIMQAGRVAPSRLAVVPRAASLPYRHTSKTVAEVAGELHADYLVEGTLRGDARRVRVAVELIRVSDAASLWNDDFDRDTGDSLALETEVAASITEKIKYALVGSSEAGPGPSQPEALSVARQSKVK
jgi:TolB-like protein/DNA-binding winged helix-turn-helix (wHTH) protein